MGGRQHQHQLRGGRRRQVLHNPYGAVHRQQRDQLGNLGQGQLRQHGG
jgi:hypothetical protein